MKHQKNHARGKYNRYWRRFGESILDTLLCRGVVARICYRLGLHGRLSITEYCCDLPSSHSLHSPLTIAFLSDFHAGPTTDSNVFKAAFSEIAQRNISLLLLGGDFISHSAEYIHDLLPYLAQVEAPLGKFAVFGNHDLWADHHYLLEQLNRVGVTFLVNQNTLLPAPFDMVAICGTDDPWTGNVDMQSTLDTDAAVKLLMTHSPDGLHFLEDEKFHFAFSGHTHGGQIATPRGTPIVLPHGQLSKRYYYGQHQIPKNGTLIVSRGIGCSNLPIRINADPELVIVQLR